MIRSALACFALLSLARAASAQPITVGPGGDHPLVQDAVAAAESAGGNQEIRIRSGTYLEEVVLFSLDDGESLSLSGGWNASFSQRSADPTATVIDGNATVRPLTFVTRDGAITIENLTLSKGFTTDTKGAGLFARGFDQDSKIVLRDLVIRDNVTASNTSATGGGMTLEAEGSTTVTVERVELVGNTASSTTGSDVEGAGFSVFAAEEGEVVLRDLDLHDNRAAATANQINGGAARFSVFGSARVSASDVGVVGNFAENGGGGCLGSMLYASVESDATGSPSQLLLESWEVRDNSTADLFCPQAHLYVESESPAELIVRSSLFAGGTNDGVWLIPFGAGAQIQANHLTVTDFDRDGISLFQGSGAPKPTLSNSIAFGNGIENLKSPENGQLADNLVDIDPLFANATADDYGLRPGSAAIDAGQLAPPGGLSAFDLAGNPRIRGAAPDLGAFEAEPGGSAPDPCVATETTLCLNGGRFEVEVAWETPGGDTGSGMDVGFGSDDSGLFWFFEPENWELMIKVLNACGFAGHYWVFAAATTNVEYTLTVTDTATGGVQTYFNPQGVRSPAITDTEAFATCP